MDTQQSAGAATFIEVLRTIKERNTKIFAILCLYFMHLDFGYGRIVFICIVKHKLTCLLAYLLTYLLIILTYLNNLCTTPPSWIHIYSNK